MLASLAASICALGSACAARIWVSVSRPCVCFVHSWSVGNFSSPPLDPSRLRGDTADVSASSCRSRAGALAGTAGRAQAAATRSGFACDRSRAARKAACIAVARGSAKGRRSRGTIREQWQEHAAASGRRRPRTSQRGPPAPSLALHVDYGFARPELTVEPAALRSWNAPLAPQALETGDFGIVEPIL